MCQAHRPSLHLLPNRQSPNPLPILFPVDVTSASVFLRHRCVELSLRVSIAALICSYTSMVLKKASKTKQHCTYIAYNWWCNLQIHANIIWLLRYVLTFCTITNDMCLFACYRIQNRIAYQWWSIRRVSFPSAAFSFHFRVFVPQVSDSPTSPSSSFCHTFGFVFSLWLCISFGSHIFFFESTLLVVLGVFPRGAFSCNQFCPLREWYVVYKFQRTDPIILLP